MMVGQVLVIINFSSAHHQGCAGALIRGGARGTVDLGVLIALGRRTAILPKVQA